MSRRALVGVTLVISAWSCAGARSGGDPTPAAPPPATQPVAPDVVDGVRCGAASCTRGAEVCCHFSDVAVCAPASSAADAPMSRWPDQAKACGQASTTELSLTAMSACDDSGDCSGEQRCCSEAIGSDLSIDTCQVEACSYGELCSGGACKTPGTECVAGRCRKGPVRECAGKACSAAAPLCCGPFGADAPSCHDEAGCSAGDLSAHYECTAQSDCPAGERCQTLIVGTRCQASFDPVNAGLVCASDADCAADVCAIMVAKRARCAQLDDGARP
jgi:hypothetical protein